ncbi:phosphatidylethanolamine-binding protein 4 [Eleutherodactylus coqui]|uniref:Phosphatidylethanolamine-binding protein 4 n=1 Tax=Eleutherodactylus coqui TaxID=57060 RepID=A0A8J6FIG3_ELECQ|nr:hypothetical protein GDO78_004895 [Eleutherodactylus coqui]KAG9488592.1 hypothetical protein GDO78_004895 [Eleutherodactylus coqui]
MWKALVLHVCRLSLLGLVATIHATCVLKPITGDDAEFCCDDLHVVHPDIGDVACKSILHCDNVSQRLLKDGGAPVVTYQKAQKDKMYSLLMMDPDAPSRESPGNKYWNHWVIADIQGRDLQSGKSLQGREITEYKGPSPPANTGFHRYQFFLYLQPPGSRPSLLPSEEKSRGKFNPEAFALRFGLGKAVATTQYMVRNPQQKDL